MAVMAGEGSIDYRGLAAEVHDRLRARILSGALRDGERIVERDLAEEYGVSRGPIRDALRLLESEGLVVTAPRRGTRVAALTAADAVEIFAMRAALEPLAVRFLIDQHDPAHFARLEEHLTRLENAAKANDWPAAVALDMEFHGLIFELSGQRRLQKVWESMRVPLLQLFAMLRQGYASIDQVPTRHREYFESIAGGDAEAAQAAAHEHVTAFQDQVLAILRGH